MLSMVMVMGDGVGEVHGLLVMPTAIVVGVLAMLVLYLIQ
jgi:hypothetical protein